MTHPEPTTQPELEARIEGLLDAMTLEEQVALLAGGDIWTTSAVERLGVPAIKVSDGPNGARGGGSLVGGVRAACFPVGIALASSWDTELVEQIGLALADEARSKGAHVLLAPTVNIHRTPLNGRSFECYSEDPFLSARIGSAYIVGVQKGGVAATVKHYVGNESEFERTTMSSEIDERALREIYLPPFEAAVKEAGTWAVMSSYNRVNGTYVGEDPGLLNGVLKGEWGFDGVVMSDWFATKSTGEAVEAGMDLEMPGPARFRGEKLAAAVRAGEASPEAVREAARRMLRLIGRVGGFERPADDREQAIDRPEHRALIRRAGAAGCVLLKNNGALPLDRGRLSTLAVIGPNAGTAQIMGGGSAQVNAHYRVSPFEAIQALVGDEVELAYEPGCTNSRYMPLIRSPFKVEYFNSLDFSGPAVRTEERAEAEVMWFNRPGPEVEADFSARLTGRFTAAESGEHRFGLVSGGLSRLLIDGRPVVDNWTDWQQGDAYFGTGSLEALGTLDLEAGRTYDLTIEYAAETRGPFGIKAVRCGAMLPLGDAAIGRAAALAAGADAAIVFAGLTAEWDTEGQDRPHLDLVGRQDELIAAVAAANPNTIVVLQSGGALAMPWLDAVAGVVQAWYPGQECGNAIADVLFGAVNPSGKLPQTFPARLEDTPAHLNYPGENGRVRYGEGIFVGYRYYDKKLIAPLFPFGFGLSYTSFAYSGLRLSAAEIAPEQGLTVSLEVANTGQRAGQEIVQLYVRDVRSSLARPERELKGFAKVDLETGASATVTIELDARALAFWDDARHAWVVEAGEFEVLAGASSQDIRARATFQVSATAELGA
ncbi:MAG TPA: glycoside hydrolase family 3 C-terminal domain-containing protein [Herpetosiphonaceae bacterium]|nr:glycoside hydrolase family 3 C-terminal domain-containing protein [Herpetosiphonaceae bacterium]